MRAIILAAGVGRRLERFTHDPKCLVKIGAEPLIVRSVRLLNECGIKNITVVTGYKAGKVKKVIRSYGLKVKTRNNPDFKRGSILSLWQGMCGVKGGLIIMDADLYFEKGVMQKMADSKKKDFFLIDTTSGKDSEAVNVGFRLSRAVALARGLKGKYAICGEWAGILKISERCAAALKDICRNKVSSGETDTGYEFIIPELFKNHRISYELIDGMKWVEIDFPKDVKRARGLSC